MSIKKWELEKELREMDDRLSKINYIILKKAAEKYGFDSPCIWIYHNIKMSDSRPSDIIKETGIKRDAYFGIQNRILSMRENGEIIKRKQEFDSKVKKCGYCGKNKRVGWYYCAECKKTIDKITREYDIDMMGSF